MSRFRRFRRTVVESIDRTHSPMPRASWPVTWGISVASTPAKTAGVGRA